MWIFTNDAFVSIVQVRDDPDVLMVRGRFAGDCARFLGLPKSSESVTPAADYRFRIVAGRREVEAAMLRACRRIDYPNFKDSVRAKWRASALMRVWAVMFQSQADRLRR
jgi:hypothetical protein